MQYALEDLETAQPGPSGRELRERWLGRFLTLLLLLTVVGLRSYTLSSSSGGRMFIRSCARTLIAARTRALATKSWVRRCDAAYETVRALAEAAHVMPEELVRE